jgi:hypothetical protein
MSHNPGLSKFLRGDHEVFTELAEKIIQTVVEGDREDVAEAVSALEASILNHLEGEEREVIPRFARENPEEAAALLKEHEAIRKRLTELDISADLHLVRADSLRLLLDALLAHAKREDAGLYAWTETHPADEVPLPA